MDFSKVTAMSIGGHSVSSVWLKGVQVWPTSTTYYFPFRLINQGSYLTWSQFQADSWNSIRLNDDMQANEITFTKNQVGHITDGSGNTVFYLSATNSTYSGGGHVYLLNNSEWEYSSTLLQNAATTNTLSAFNTAGINDIEGIYTGYKPAGIPIFISDGEYTCGGHCTGPVLQWSVSYYDTEINSTQYLSECVAINGTEIHYDNYDGIGFNCIWGSDPGGSIFYLPYSMAGNTVRFDYFFDCQIDTYSPYYGHVDVYVPADATDIHVQLPNLSGSV